MIFLRILKESIRFAVHSVTVNKLRTLLTLLGITVGIFAIISVFTILDWMEKSVRESISSLGENTIYIQKWPWSFDPNIKWWEIMKRPIPTIEEYEKLRKRSVKSEAMAFVISTSVTVSYLSNKAENISFLSATNDFSKVRFFEIARGRFFSDFEAKSGKNRAVIGADLAKELFDDTDPLGKKITIRGRKLTVIGIFKKEGAGGLGDEGLDKVVFVPVNHVRNIINIRSESLNPLIMVRAKEGVSIGELKDEITGLMRSIRKLRPSAPDTFSLNQASMLTQGINAIFKGINLGGWIIGGFSILVGGFGIANIMFVSVKERTNIIGIQKALGAKNNFILQQFLYESIILSVMGGVLGLVFVFAGTLVINRMEDMNITLTLGNIVLGLTISAVIGIISGYAPAFSASRLNPVEAIGTTF